MVLVPAGVFQIGLTELRSNVTLHISAGGTLLGSADGKQYRAIDEIPLRGDSTLGDGNWSLLFAVNAKNVTVEGPGMIDGEGQQFRSLVRGEKPPSGIGGAQRPYHLLFYRCENVVVRDLDLVRCAFHSIRVIQSSRVHMDNLYIHNRVNTNNDGFHFISCEYVTISGSSGRVGEDGGAGALPVAFVRNISFSNIRATVVAGPPAEKEGQLMGRIYDGEQNSCITLNGVGDVFLENISFSDVHVTFAGGGTAEHAAKRDIPQIAREYVGVWAQPPFGPPAYGLYARNVNGLTLHNIRFEVANPDLRPAIVFDNVQDGVINSLSAQGNPGAESLMRFTDTKDVLLTACRVITPAAVFLQVEGTANENIKVGGGDLSKVAAPLAFRNGAKKESVIFRK
jgi:polygalacturonase